MYISQYWQEGSSICIRFGDVCGDDMRSVQAAIGYDVVISKVVNKQQLVGEYKKAGMLK